MPEPKEIMQRARLNAVLNRLVQIGWIKGFIVHDTHDTMNLEWTEKGKERARQVVEIVAEFHGGPDDLMALAAICRAHPPV
jgi:hypothetical protein